MFQHDKRRSPGRTFIGWIVYSLAIWAAIILLFWIYHSASARPVPWP